MTIVQMALLPSLLVTASFAVSVFGDENDSTRNRTASSSASTEITDNRTNNRHRALIICGLSGDASHHKLFAETVTKLHAGLTMSLGISPQDIQVLFGDEPSDDDTEVIRSSVRSTREELEKAISFFKQKTQADDSCWVIVLGHCHYDGRQSWLNLPGPDIQQNDFAKLFDGLLAQQQIFMVATPTSGFFIKPLSTAGRVVISATDVDWETNETEFPHELARVLSASPTAKELDVDQDGAITLLDLYLTVTRNLAQSYVERELLATEHPRLDDNGDGRGTELQIDYLTEEQGGRLKPNKPIRPAIAPTSDGSLARSIKLPLKQE